VRSSVWVTIIFNFIFALVPRVLIQLASSYGVGHPKPGLGQGWAVCFAVSLTSGQWPWQALLYLLGTATLAVTVAAQNAMARQKNNPKP
jgi:hypothetical protein